MRFMLGVLLGMFLGLGACLLDERDWGTVGNVCFDNNTCRDDLACIAVGSIKRCVKK